MVRNKLVRNKLVRNKLERSGVGHLDVIDPRSLHTAVMNDDYERRREENIRKNNELLAQLGLDVVKRALEPGSVRRQAMNNASGS